MKYGLMTAATLAVCTLTPLTARAQVAHSDAFSSELRASAAFAPHATAEKRAIPMDADEHHAQHAAWIGAAIGAVALPLGAYAAFHDSDSGPPKAGGILLFAAIGGLLGWMIGYSIIKH